MMWKLCPLTSCTRVRLIIRLRGSFSIATHIYNIIRTAGESSPRGRHLTGDVFFLKHTSKHKLNCTTLRLGNYHSIGTYLHAGSYQAQILRGRGWEK